jgi:hypothetical protein
MGKLKIYILQNESPYRRKDKEKIRKGILKVPNEELLRVNYNLFKRHGVCARTVTAFQHVL